MTRTGVLRESGNLDTHTHTQGIPKTHRKKLAVGLECRTYK